MEVVRHDEERLQRRHAALERSLSSPTLEKKIQEHVASSREGLRVLTLEKNVGNSLYLWFPRFISASRQLQQPRKCLMRNPKQMETLEKITIKIAYLTTTNYTELSVTLLDVQ